MTDESQERESQGTPPDGSTEVPARYEAVLKAISEENDERNRRRLKEHCSVCGYKFEDKDALDVHHADRHLSPVRRQEFYRARSNAIYSQAHLRYLAQQKPTLNQRIDKRIEDMPTGKRAATYAIGIPIALLAFTVILMVLGGAVIITIGAMEPGADIHPLVVVPAIVITCVLAWFAISKLLEEK